MFKCFTGLPVSSRLNEILQSTPVKHYRTRWQTSWLDQNCFLNNNRKLKFGLKIESFLLHIALCKFFFQSDFGFFICDLTWTWHWRCDFCCFALESIYLNISFLSIQVLALLIQFIRGATKLWNLRWAVHNCEVLIVKFIVNFKWHKHENANKAYFDLCLAFNVYISLE